MKRRDFLKALGALIISVPLIKPIKLIVAASSKSWVVSKLAGTFVSFDEEGFTINWTTISD